MTVNPGSVKANYQLDIPLAHLNPLVTGYSDMRKLAKVSFDERRRSRI